MNTNSGNDPMLSSFINDDWGKFTSSVTVVPVHQMLTECFSPTASVVAIDGLLAPEPQSAVSHVWSSERKIVMTSVRIEADEKFLISPYAPSEEIDNRDIDMNDINIENNTKVAGIKSEIEESEFDNMDAETSLDGHECNSEYDTSMIETSFDIPYCKQETSTFQMNELEARKYVEEQFEKIAFLPSANINQTEKIAFILAQSDCSEYSIENVLNFDKRSPESARACAKIVQNIPQRYRWECVIPESIPCCYTIVADCKKVSSRDKPPRPMNAFMIWAQGARRLINELCPKMQNALISEALGYYWRQKSDAFKKSFEQEKIKLRRFHNVEFPEYKYKPKTKIQKAKEKQELSLNKAKMRAFVKDEKLNVTDDSATNRKRSKSGRPRKGKPVSTGKKINKAPLRDVISEQSNGSSSTKPHIKDMLSLKILGDKKSKVVTPDLNMSDLSECGQLSPLEIGSPYVSDAFDDHGSFQISLVGHVDTDMSSSSRQLMLPSVYDTPANTPPVDIDDELHLSPPYLHSTSSLPPKTAETKDSTLYRSSNASIKAQDNIMLLSHIPTTQISTTKTVSNVKSDQRALIGSSLNKSIAFSAAIQPSTVSINQTLDFSDLLFTYVTEALSSSPIKSTYLDGSREFNSHTTRDNNNNSASVDSNNNIDITSNIATSARNNKNVNCVIESNDLDTLRLDLYCPILSDDDMISLLNTL